MQRTESDCTTSPRLAAEWSAAVADLMEEIEEAQLDFDRVTLEDFKRRLVRKVRDRHRAANCEQATVVAT